MKNISTVSSKCQKSAIFAVLSLLGSVAGHAADVNQVADAASSQSWATGSLWDSGSPASDGNHYFTNGYRLRTPDVPTGSTVFPTGAILTINGGVGGSRGALNLKAGTTTIGDLRLGVGTVMNGVATGSSGNMPAILNVTNLTILDEAVANEAALIQGTWDNNNLALNVTNLMGNGFLRFTNPRNYSLTVSNSSSFGGEINIHQGRMTIAGDISLGGGIFSMATSGAFLVLDHNLSVASFVFGNTTLSTEGQSYTSSDLNALLSTNVFSGSGTLSIAAIPEASTMALAFAMISLSLLALRFRRHR